MLVFATASLIGKFSSVFTTVGQFVSFSNLTDGGKQKQLLLYLIIAAKSSDFFFCRLYYVSIYTVRK